MITKLPKWVEAGGFFLAFIAGFVNAVALLGFNHQGVSHLTGSSTLLGVELAQANFQEIIHLALIIASFVVGAAVSGFVIGNESLKLRRRYSVALFVEAILLLLAMVLLQRGSNLGHYVASATCGLQNAMTSTFSGAVVRTTHVTGLFTDLGITAGLWFRGRRPDIRRIILYSTLISGFIVGGCGGALCFNLWGFYALIVPSFFAASISITYLWYFTKTKLHES